jgi:uncharacterized protein (TIGR03086 family)
VAIDQRELHRTALRTAGQQVSRILPSDLGRATPCAGWWLAELLAHMIGQHRGFAQAVRHGAAPAHAYAQVPFTHAEWRDSVAELTDAFADADLDQPVVPVELSPTSLALSRVVAAQLLDTVVHTWDIARSLGHGYTPSAALLTATALLARSLPDSARGPGAAFGRLLPVSGAVWADTLALTGRDIAWELDASPSGTSRSDTVSPLDVEE